MKFIQSVRRIHPKQPNGITVVYMHGYGGHTWQAGRQLRVLEKGGYEIVALDFKKVLEAHDPQDLLSLMEEVDEFFKQENLVRRDVIMVGISMGGLIGYNLVRRHPELHKLIVITGGNIALLPSEKSLKKDWKLTRQQLTELWASVNMYTPIGGVKDKHIVMMLPLRDKVINPKEVEAEIALQQTQNDIKVIRTKGGHFRTIINQTVVRPQKILPLLKELERF